MRKVTLLSALVLLLATGTGLAQGPVTIVAELPSLPEGLAIDGQGNLYAGMALTGEIYKIAPATGRRELYAVLPSKAQATFLTGLEFDPTGALYACVVSFDPSIWSGVYKVPPGGGSWVRFAGPVAFPNGLAFDARGNLYVSSSTDAKIYRADPAGKLTVFSDAEPLKSHTPHGRFTIGVNGLGFDKAGNLHAANTDDGKILKIAVNADGTAGPISEVATGLPGADGIAFDSRGNLFIALNRQDRVVVLTPEGQVKEVASGPLLKFPSSVAPFGDRLYIANFNFPTKQPPFTIAVVPLLPAGR
jgi:sugar lactone lactonase YvrE